MIREDKDSILFEIKVIPKSSLNKIEMKDTEIRLKITAPPVDGKANKAVIAFLAKRLKVSKSSVIIEKGDTGRHKLIRVLGINKQTFLDGF